MGDISNYCVYISKFPSAARLYDIECVNKLN